MRDLKCLNQGPDPQLTICGRWRSETYDDDLHTRVEREIASYRELGAVWPKPKEAYPHHPFNSPSWWRCYDLKLEPTFIIWALGMGRVSHAVQCKWNRHWSNEDLRAENRHICVSDSDKKLRTQLSVWFPNKSFYLDHFFHVKDTKTVACHKTRLNKLKSSRQITRNVKLIKIINKYRKSKLCIDRKYLGVSWHMKLKEPNRKKNISF